MSFRSVFALTLILFARSLLSHETLPIGLRISPFGQSVQPSHQQFVLTCKGIGAEPNLFTNLRWFDPRGQEITETYSKSTNPDLRVEELQFGVILLHFLNPNSDNSGQYSCSADFQHSDSFEAKIQINFFQDVQWEDCPAVQSLVLFARNERIRCKAKANPKPNISWSKEGQPLENDPRYQIDANGIAINDVVEERDGGVFRVRALVTETGRLHDTSITVQILVRPQVLDLPNHFQGTEGEEATLKCEARGVPEPVFTWFDPNKRNLSSVGGYAVDRNGGALIISRVRALEDNGTFTCIAENTAGADQRTTRLVVLRKPRITSFQNQSFDENAVSILECRATGEPRPRLAIRRDGDSRELTIGDPRVSMEVLDESEEKVLRLKLSPTTRADDGLYFCRADNTAMTAENRAFGHAIVERVGHLEVRFAPDLRRTPLTSVKHWNSKPINITCIAESIPNATIRWWFRGQEISNRIRGSNSQIYTFEESTLGTSRLHIKPSIGSASSDIYGQYRCEAINSLGTADIRIQVEQAFRPGAVMSVSHETVTPTTVTFRLLAPSFDGGLPIKTIHVQYRQEDRDWQHLMTKKWPLNRIGEIGQYFLDGLLPRTRYLFRFAAENDVGIGDFSADKVILTARETVPDRPEFHNLPVSANEPREVVSPFPDHFMATWTLPADNGRPIRYFELKSYPVRKTELGFEATGVEERVHSVSMTDQSMTSYTLKNLKPNSYYKIELRANNHFGFSDVESVVFRTSDGKPIEDDDRADVLKTSSSPTLALIMGLLIAFIVILLLTMDSIFFWRYKVGVIYFLSRHVFPTANHHITASSDPHKSTPDVKDSPPFGRTSRATPVRMSCSVDNPAFESRTQSEDQNLRRPFIGEQRASRDSAV